MAKYMVDYTQVVSKGYILEAESKKDAIEMVQLGIASGAIPKPDPDMNTDVINVEAHQIAEDNEDDEDIDDTNHECHCQCECSCNSKETADEAEKDESDVNPYKVKDIIDTIISHNSIVSLYVDIGHKSKQVWHGMAHRLPEEYLNREFVKIFGAIADGINTSDTIRIMIK